MPEGRLRFGLGAGVRTALSIPIATVAMTVMRRIAARAIYAKKVLDLCREMARLIGMFFGREREAREASTFLVRHIGRTGGKKLGHADDFTWTYTRDWVAVPRG